MRHQRSGKKLGRDSAHRKALYANLTGALIEHGRIRTTITKAKAVKPIAEQMITLGRRGDIHARRQAVAFLRSKDIVHKLFTEVAPRFAERPGGYSRIVKLGPRAGDAAEMVYLELVDSPLVFKTRLPREEVGAIADEATVVDDLEADGDLEAEAEVEAESEADESAEAETAEPEASAPSDDEAAAEESTADAATNDEGAEPDEASAEDEPAK